MSRDYKQSDRRAAKDGGSPLFTGVLIGLFVGLAVAIGVAVYINFSPKPFVSRDKPKPPAEAGKAPASSETAALPPENPSGSAGKAEKPTGKPRFDFYTILPGSEVPATERDLKQEKRPEGAAKETYFLQAGSFQTATEADNMKARLALLGLEASIQTADIPDKGIWHRVRIGPFTNIDDMNRARDLLTQNHLSASPVKVRDTTTP